MPIASSQWSPVTGQESRSFFFTPPIRYLHTLIRFPWPFSAPGWTVPTLSLNPFWLLPVTFLTFIYLETFSRIICPVTFQGIEVRLTSMRLIWMFCLALLEDRGDNCFFPVFGNFYPATAFHRCLTVASQWQRPAPSAVMGRTPSGPRD